MVGFKLTGELPEGATSTDLVLTVTELLRHHGVVGKFLEFFGEGVGKVALYNRATIGNMSPEYGSTCAIFPIDDETLRYLRFTGRSDEHVSWVEAYAKSQGLWLDPAAEPAFTDTVELDLSTVEPCLAGPAWPQDRVPLRRARVAFGESLAKVLGKPQGDLAAALAGPAPQAARDDYELAHGDVVIATITSCTNTSNPDVMVAAGLVAKRRTTRPFGQALGQSIAHARLEGGDRLLQSRGPHTVPRQVGFRTRGLRLHDLYRQQRAAAARRLRGRGQKRPRRSLGTLRQPQF